jgi:hypothetical protein
VADAARVETTVVVIVVVVVVIVHADWTATCDYINFFLCERESFVGIHR